MGIDSGNTDNFQKLKDIFESNDIFIKEFYGSFKNLNSKKLFDPITGNSLGKNFIEDGFNKIYEKKSEQLVTELKQSLSKLSSLRSNYVPWDIARSITSERNELLGEAKVSGYDFSIPSDKFIKESYENCFMRAMGMPESDNIIEAIKAGGSFSYLDIYSNKATESISDQAALLENILNQRELVPIRTAKVTSDFFSFQENVRSLDSYIYDDKREDFNKIVEGYDKDISRGTQSGFFTYKSGGSFTEEQLFQMFFADVSEFNISESSAREFFRKNILRVSKESLKVFNLHENLWRIKYLLVPPVQNSSISSCVSEARKIIDKPFQNKNKKIVNRRTTRTSFMETVIRIRLDKVTGLSYNKVTGVLKSVANSASGQGIFGEEKEEVFINDFADFSLIENIIINRLRKALTAAVKNLEKDIENYIISAGESMSQPSLENKGKTGEESNTDSKVKVNVSEGLFGQNLSRLNYISSLKDLRSVDEAILFLLSDKEKISALELINDGLRSSSLRDGIFLEEVVSSISIVKNYLDEELERVESFLKQKERSNNGSNESISKISQVAGIYKGVGYLDILAFAIAMFTVKEEVLIGTLNSEQYNNLKKEIQNPIFFLALDEKNFGKNRNKIQLESVNILTKRLIEIYILIEQLLKEQ